jgi:hypothetical protein
VHKHRNLLAHARERLHEEISADYKDMIYAATREEIETRRKAFIRKSGLGPDVLRGELRLSAGALGASGGGEGAGVHRVRP